MIKMKGKQSSSRNILFILTHSIEPYKLNLESFSSYDVYSIFIYCNKIQAHLKLSLCSLKGDSA